MILKIFNSEHKYLRPKVFIPVICFALALAVVLLYPRLPKLLNLNNRPELATTKTNRASPKNLSLGTNLGGIADYSTQIPFIDAFKFSRKWITQCIRDEPGCSGGWSTNEFDKLNLDKQGWVKSLPVPEDPTEYTRVGTLMFREIGRYPGGKYIVLYEGEGTIEYKFDAHKDKAASRPGRDVINVTPSNAGIYLVITSTDPNKTGNYIRNIHVVPAQYEKTYQTQIFNPEFIKRIKPFRALRFMDWMSTNNSEQSEWNKRPTVDKATYSYDGGVPVEIMIELANRLKVDSWFNMPHQATDEYMTNFAQMVKDSLDPKLKVFVELSNEVWNQQFKQQHYASQQGKARWGQNKADDYMQWYGMRTAQMCNIWKSTFGKQKSRVVCVMGTQTSTSWKGFENFALECSYWVAEGHKPCYQHGIDVYAITGYFGGGLGSSKNASKVESWLNEPNGSFSKAFEKLKDSIEKNYENFIKHADIAKQKGLQLVVYEGGQHIVGREGVESNDKLTKFFIELNRRPEMYDLYSQLLNNWKKAGGTLFMNFSDIGKPSKWGSWGVLEHVDQDHSPKYDALIDFIKKNS